MNAIAKIRSVARCEYLKAVRSKAFIAGIVLMPLLMGGSVIAMAIAESAEDYQSRSFAVIDRSDRLLPVIESAVDWRNENEIVDADGEQYAPRWELISAEPEATDADTTDAPTGGTDAGLDPAEDAASGESTVAPMTSAERLDLALADRVRSGELFGFLTIGADVFQPSGGPDDGMAWSTDSPTNDDLPDWLERLTNQEIRRERFASAGLDPTVVDRLSARRRVRTLGLAEVNADTGEIDEAEESDKIATIVVPLALAFLMFMLTAMSTPVLLNNVLEEKMQKIAEVLVSSVSPFQLLLGKLASAVGISMTLTLVYLGGALLFVHNNDSVPPAVVEALSPSLLMWFGFFMLLGLVIYGSVFSAIGSACSEIQDAQTLMMPAMIVFILPMMFLGPVVESPDGVFAQALSMFPPTTPVIMFLRIAMPPGVAWWELAFAVLTTTAFAAGMVWAGGRIFRVGILFQGQTPSFRKLITWMWQG